MRLACSIEHHVAGRTRIRVLPKQAVRHCAGRLQAYLASRAGVDSVRLNVDCASVVVGFDPRQLTAARIANDVQQFVAAFLQEQAGRFQDVVLAPTAIDFAAIAARPPAAESVAEPRAFLARLSDRASALARHAATVLAKPAAAEELNAVPDQPAAAEAEDVAPVPAWHAMSAEEVARCLQVDAGRGLSLDEATDRLVAWGPNSLGGVQQRSRWSILAGQFTSLPVALLVGSAAISVATGGIADAVVILAVVAINAVIGDVTERRAEATIASLLDEQVPPAMVLRDGFRQPIASELVVPGDLLVISPGVTIAADARLVRAERLLVDESALTGESQPVDKSTQAFAVAQVALRERRNMVYRGTVATGGSGLALVVATGKATEVGKIEGLVAAAEAPETPVQRQLRELGSKLGLLSGGICVGIFALGALRGQGWLQMLSTATSLAVAAIPEGLPMVATTTLALGVTRMRKRHVSVRRLDAVEALGAIQVFCLDKTGTLTLNRMQVQRLFVGMQTLVADEQGIRPLEEQERGPLEQTDSDPAPADSRFVTCEQHEELRRLLEVGALCNETQIDDDGPARRLNGSPTESALVHLALDAGVDVAHLRHTHPVERTEYRTESRSYMATIHRRPALRGNGGDGGWLVAVKGRPADVLELCRWQLHRGRRMELTPADRDQIRTANEQLAGQALRVLGFAYRDYDGDWSESGEADERDLIWLGLAGIADPIRPGMRELMATFHRSGIRTIMITGDQSATAYAIGRQLNLSGEQRLDLIDSTELEKIDPNVLKSLAQEVEVFSAVTPSHKLEIVQALQRAGLVVAMTGDGINDGPALRAADIGVAMGGAAGTEVARRTADVILEDDNLHTMVEAIGQGRTIYGNTRNAIRYLLATNLSEILFMFAGVAGGFGSPLNAMQLLWINLVSDIFPVLALAIQPAEPDVLEWAPRDPHEPFLAPSDTADMLFQSSTITAGTVASYAWGRWRYGTPAAASTMAFTTITAAQLFQMVSSRSSDHSLFSHNRPTNNAFLNWALVGGLALQLVTVVAPPLRRLLRNATLTPTDVAASLLTAAAPVLANEAVKELRLRTRTLEPSAAIGDVLFPQGSSR